MHKKLYEKIHHQILKEFEDKGFTISEHYFVDGYFIFDYGKSAVMHFKLKEVPQWKFGVWLNYKPATKPYTLETKEFVRYEIFAQNELWIDKFKPSASEFTSDGKIYLTPIYTKDETKIRWFDKENIELFINVMKFRLLWEEPYLAFRRHMSYCSFDEIHVTRRQAKRFYKKFLRNEAKEKRRDSRNLEKQFKFVNEWFKLRDVDFVVRDNNAEADGWYTSPEYGVVVTLPDTEAHKTVAENLYSEFIDDLRSFKNSLKHFNYSMKEVSDHLVFEFEKTNKDS